MGLYETLLNSSFSLQLPRAGVDEGIMPAAFTFPSSNFRNFSFPSSNFSFSRFSFPSSNFTFDRFSFPSANFQNFSFPSSNFGFRSFTTSRNSAYSCRFAGCTTYFENGVDPNNAGVFAFPSSNFQNFSFPSANFNFAFDVCGFTPCSFRSCSFSFSTVTNFAFKSFTEGELQPFNPGTKMVWEDIVPIYNNINLINEKYGMSAISIPDNTMNLAFADQISSLREILSNMSTNSHIQYNADVENLPSAMPGSEIDILPLAKIDELTYVIHSNCISF